MDLLLWRHAQAHDAADGGDDMARSLTKRGKAQARSMAGWLERQLPPQALVLVSPARRTEQTAMALGRAYTLAPALAPGQGVDRLLASAHWPDGTGVVLVVGHQPTLGQTIARLLDMRGGQCAVKKGALWWLRTQGRGKELETVIVAVQSAELL